MNELPPSFDVEYFSFVSPDRDTNATRKLDREEREVNTRAIEHLREQAGTIVRGYTIDRVIGSGTYSCVFRAKRRVRLRLTDGQMARRSERLEKNGRGAAPRFARAPDYAEVVKTVAIKQIYVTASRTRIKQEVSALKAIKALQCPQLLNIISAHRSKDQVILIMPYEPHIDCTSFMFYYSLRDMAAYTRDLLRACAAMHSINLIHRDIKPGNFCWNPLTRRGVLVDFGLAQTEADSSKPGPACPCLFDFDEERCSNYDQEAKHASGCYSPTSMSWRTRSAIPNHGSSAIKVAERGGTRGYRAPEVLLHCTSQSTAIDIWSVGITLLCFLTQSKVFFNCEDDTDATVELSHIIGTANLKRVAFQHGSHMQINIPTAPVEAVPWIDVIQHEAMERKAHLNGSRFDLRALTASKGTRPRQTVPQASYNSLSRQTNANLMPLQPLPTNVVAQRMHQLNQEKQRQRSEPVAVNNPAVFGLPQRSHTHATAGCLTQQQIIRPLPSRAFVPQSERPRKMTVFRDVEQRPEDELTMTPPTSTTSSIQAQQLPTTAEPTFREIAWPPRSRSPDRPHESKRDVFYLDSTWPFLEPYDAERLNAACEFLSHALEPDYKTRWTADQLLNSDFIQSAGE